MNNKIINKVISLIVAFITAIGLFAGVVNAQADSKTTTEVKKYPLSLDMDIVLKSGDGYIHPGAKNQVAKNIENMWANLPITVEDENGNKIDVKKELQSNFQRFVGNFAIGQKLTITIDTNSILDGYNLSYNADHEYISQASGYSKFTVKYHLDKDNDPMVVRISFGKMNVKFDPKGGNIGSESGTIIKTVKKDNTVDFPANPTKKDLEFGGWYTELPDIEAYRQRNIVGKRYYWDNNSLFSDCNRDWQTYNDTTLDPLYDGVFLLRAQWNARYTFNANGGTFSDGTAKKSEAVQQGKNINILPAPTREDYQFLNWADAADKTYKPGDTYTLNANTVFTAKWKQIRNTVTFKNGDNTHAAVKVETGKAIDTDTLTDQSMPKNPKKDGYTFKEWNTSSDGKGKAFTGTTPVNSDLTVYAIFTKNTDGDNDDDNDGGSVVPDSTDNPELNVGGGSVNNNRTLNGAANGSADGAANGAADNVNGVENRSDSAKSRTAGTRSSGVLPNGGADASGVTLASFVSIVFGLFVASGAVLNRKRAKYLR